MEDEKPAAHAGSASAAESVAANSPAAADAPRARERIGDDDAAAQDGLAGAAAAGHTATGHMATSDSVGGIDGTADETVVTEPEHTTTVAGESAPLSPSTAAATAIAAAEERRADSPFAHPPPTQSQPPPNPDPAQPQSPQPQSPTAQSPPPGSNASGKQPLAGAGFVAPSSYLRPLAVRSSASQEKKGGGAQGQAQGQWEGGQNSGSGMVGSMGGPVGGPVGGVGGRIRHPLDKEQTDGLRAIRAFLKVRTTYDVLPLSYRLIVLDTSLLVKKSLNILNQCGIVSAPLWDSQTSTFAGLLTTSDYLNVVQYYWQNPDALAAIDQFKLNSLRDIERALGVTPIETVSIHPLKTLYEACRRMLESRARRIPLVDIDDETGREMVVSVLTQYRILKFVSVNVKETQMLRKPLRDLHVGSYENLSYAHMESPVMEVIHALVKRSISSVPILDRDGAVLNVFEAVDVIALIKGGDYDNLQLTVGKALEKRSEDFPGIYTCTLNDRLDTIFDTIRKSRVHRLVVIDERSQLVGLLSLSDILDYTLNSPLGDGANGGEES